MAGIHVFTGRIIEIIGPVGQAQITAIIIRNPVSLRLESQKQGGS
jgi:hypothetical protein